MLSYLFAVVASCCNAAASVLQRKANKNIPREEEMSTRLIGDLLRTPTWFAGIAAVTAGFLLQAAALREGQLAEVEPVLVIELPATVLLARLVFKGPIGRREWAAIAGMTAGLAGLLYFLAPSAGHARGVAWWTWAIGLGATAGLLACLVAWGRRTSADSARASIYGVATGLGFGVTAALMKGMTNALSGGFLHVFTAWETYAMVVCGAGSMYLLQNAVNAGRLVAAQPGITLSDPVVSILWGVFVFHEQVRSGWYAALAGASVVVIVASVIALARSPLLSDSDEEGGESGRDEEVDRDEGRDREAAYAADEGSGPVEPTGSGVRPLEA